MFTYQPMEQKSRGRNQAVGWRNQREESGWQREEDVQASSPLSPLEALRLHDSNLQIFSAAPTFCFLMPTQMLIQKPGRDSLPTRECDPVHGSSWLL